MHFGFKVEIDLVSEGVMRENRQADRADEEQAQRSRWDMITGLLGILMPFLMRACGIPEPQPLVGISVFDEDELKDDAPDATFEDLTRRVQDANAQVDDLLSSREAEDPGPSPRLEHSDQNERRGQEPGPGETAVLVDEDDVDECGERELLPARQT